ncbi:MAG: 4Fe-4S dicluster domain-containing protein [Candidatus Bathyarchaeota archaeon]
MKKLATVRFPTASNRGAVNLNSLGELMNELEKEKIPNCFQCGACTGLCPASFAMDYTPRQIIDMVHLGLWDDVLSSSTIWMCATCYACTVRCPQGVDIAEVMEGLKNIAVISGRYPSEELNFYVSFMDAIRKNGRLNEIDLVLKSMSKTELLRNIKLGVSLFRKGKIKLSSTKVKKLNQISDIFKKTLNEETNR